MAPTIATAKSELGYPLYACAFDLQDSSRLLVGGGGGASRTGVGNKITLLDTSNPDTLDQIADVDLSKDEDNVTTLAVAKGEGKNTVIYAGVNSSPADVKEGRNQHFRTFALEESATKSSEKDARARIYKTGRSSLFSTRAKDAYQRVLRLSQGYEGSARMGAVATGLASGDAEVVLFHANTKATAPDTPGRIRLTDDAVDVDIFQTGPDTYLLAYCEEMEMYMQEITKKEASEPRSIYKTPGQHPTEKPTIPSFRALRILTPEFVLMLTNIHSRGGVVLQVFRLPTAPDQKAKLSLSVRLPSTVKQATGLSVVNLAPTTDLSSPQQTTQFAVAVVGQDGRILLYTLDYTLHASVTQFSNLVPFQTLKPAHAHQITNIAFEEYTPPAHPISKDTLPQYLKLASVSVSGSVVVHTVPLSPLPINDKVGQSKTPRYVMALPSSRSTTLLGLFLTVGAVLSISLAAIVIQAGLELRYGNTVGPSATDYMPSFVIDTLEPFVRMREPRSVVDKDQVQAIMDSMLPPGTVGEDGTETVTITKTAGTASTATVHIRTVASGETDETAPPEPEAGEVPGEAAKAFREHVDSLLDLVSQNPEYVKNVVVLHGDDDGNENEAGVKAIVHDTQTMGHHGGKRWSELSEKQRQMWKARLRDAGGWARGLPDAVLKGVVFGELAGAVGGAVAGA